MPYRSVITHRVHPSPHLRVPLLRTRRHRVDHLRTQLPAAAGVDIKAAVVADMKAVVAADGTNP